MAEIMQKRKLFLGTIKNKVDAKGRVSLPAEYRTLAKEQSTSIFGFNSFTGPFIEGCTTEKMEEIASEIEKNHDYFSETQSNLTSLIFGGAQEFNFDSTGRIVLSEKLLAHAEITDEAVFVGNGYRFQIWSSQNWEKEQERIRSLITQKRPSIKPSGE